MKVRIALLMIFLFLGLVKTGLSIPNKLDSFLSSELAGDEVNQNFNVAIRLNGDDSMTPFECEGHISYSNTKVKTYIKPGAKFSFFLEGPILEKDIIDGVLIIKSEDPEYGVFIITKEGIKYSVLYGVNLNNIFYFKEGF